MTLAEQVEAFWDEDAAVYDGSASHAPCTHAELAAWRGELRRLLPDPPCGVLDVGAGTGFLSLLLAGLGYQVTAVDLSSGMLERLKSKAREAGVEIETVHGDGGDPPRGEFAAVIERHVLWTMPDARRALDAWREAAPSGRLVLLESQWGAAAAPVERVLGRLRDAVDMVRRTESGHHGSYDAALRERLPFSAGAPVEELARITGESAWGPVRLHRLRDVEWAMQQAMRLPERVLGVTPRYALVAGR